MSDVERAGPGPEFVGFWSRFLAFILDSLAATLFLGALFAILLDPSATLNTGESALVLTPASIAQTLLAAAMFIGFWIYFAATPGKMLIDAYIVDARTLRRAGNGQLIIRYVGYYICMFTLGLGFVWIAVDARKQGLHDKLARTVVIRGKPLDDRERALRDAA